LVRVEPGLPPNPPAKRIGLAWGSSLGRGIGYAPADHDFVITALGLPFVRRWGL